MKCLRCRNKAISYHVYCEVCNADNILELHYNWIVREYEYYQRKGGVPGKFNEYLKLGLWEVLK